MDGENGFGVSHLSTTPVTATFGITLLGVLILLVLLRLLFADVGGNVSVRGGAR
jgi:hypothetical protein